MTRRKKKPTRKNYSGFMEFPLLGMDKALGNNGGVKFYGDFADAEKRKRIFSKPRKFRMEIHIYLPDVGKHDITELTLPVSGVNKEKLAEILHEYAVKDADYWGEYADLNNSYFKVII